MRITFNFIRLSPESPLRIAGTVTDTAGNPLSRRVILYDEALTPIAETRSSASGQASFTVAGVNGNNRFVVRAVGNAGECDDISCHVRGEEV